MRKLIAILGLFTCVSLHAQTNALKVSGTHFCNGVDSKNWNNRTDETSTSARFKAYTGESYVSFTAAETVEIAFNCSLKLTGGDAEVVFSEAGTESGALTLFSSDHSASETEKTVRLEAGREYRLTFKGQNAKGAYWCAWRKI